MKVVIIGGGQVGAYIAALILKGNNTVKVIENRDHVLEKLKRELPQDVVISGSGTDPRILESVGIADADVVAAVTGSDETNLVASTIAKYEFGVPRVIARVNNPQNAWLFNAGMGVDVGLNQADLMAGLVVEEMKLKTMSTLLKIEKGGYSVVKFKVDEKSKAANKKVKDLGIPDRAVLIAISRNEEIIIPRGDITIVPQDSVMAFADENSKTSLNALFGA